MNLRSPFISRNGRSLEVILLVLASLLMAIWAVQHTIALRNVLIFLGFLFSILYLKRNIKPLKDSIKSWTQYIPALIVLLIFIWLFIHLFFFSLDFERGYREFRSTWVRIFSVTIFGFCIGSIASKNRNYLNLIWIGILASITVEFFQYLRLCYLNNTFFVPIDPSYIYKSKLNISLICVILSSGLLGAFICDCINARFTKISSAIQIYGLSISIFTSIFIVDSRIGVGVYFSLVAFSALFLIFFCKKNIISIKSAKVNIAILLFLLFLLLMLLVHLNANIGWNTLFYDLYTAINDHVLGNWINLPNYGYPQNGIGKTVVINNYERFAWAKAGIDLIFENPLGVGNIDKPFYFLLNEKYGDIVDKGIPGTHSGFIDMALTYGVLFVFLIFVNITCICILTYKNNKIMYPLVLMMNLGILLVYTVGELSSQHALEILFFWMSTLSVLSISPHTVVNSK
jgi:hypothetical protein